MALDCISDLPIAAIASVASSELDLSMAREFCGTKKTEKAEFVTCGPHCVNPIVCLIGPKPKEVVS